MSYLGNDGSSGATTPTTSAIPRYVAALKRLVNHELGQNIWQRGYYDHIVRNETDYRAIREYIDTNPTRRVDDKYYSEGAAALMNT